MTLYNLKRRGKRYDYFTSFLPWPQKGESVSIPLGQYASLQVVDHGYGVGVPVFADGAFSPSFFMSGTLTN